MENQNTEKAFFRDVFQVGKNRRLMSAIAQTEYFVMAGSMNSIHEHFDPFFKLAVHLNADEKLRVERAHQRELERFGCRILEGGDMYEEHNQFLRDVAGYNYGIGSATLQSHEAWIQTLPCKILRLDGALPLEENANLIVKDFLYEIHKSHRRRYFSDCKLGSENNKRRFIPDTIQKRWLTFL